MKIELGGIDLYYEKQGSGPPMLLLHGNGEDHHIFDELGRRLAASFTVYALDSRNHGRSQKTNDYAYQSMAADVLAFIQALDLGKANLVGFSDGAIIALLLAINNAQVVNKMALLGVNLKPSDFTDESLDWLKKAYAESGDPLLLLMLEEPQIELADVRRVTAPTLLVAAENDIFKPETFTELQRALPDARLKIMPGHDHDSYIVHQDILYPDLVRFFIE